MICQRPAHKSQGLLWEFPGGKVEPGESLEQALIRECREELKIRIAVGEVFMRVEHRYPDMTVRLTLFWAQTEEEPSCRSTRTFAGSPRPRSLLTASARPISPF